jgi:hypothetical protein
MISDVTLTDEVVEEGTVMGEEELDTGTEIGTEIGVLK